jgi:hypothetical protein
MLVKECEVSFLVNPSKGLFLSPDTETGNTVDPQQHMAANPRVFISISSGADARQAEAADTIFQLWKPLVSRRAKWEEMNGRLSSR